MKAHDYRKLTKGICNSSVLEMGEEDGGEEEGREKCLATKPKTSKLKGIIMGLPWWSSGYDSTFTMQGAQVRSLEGA